MKPTRYLILLATLTSLTWAQRSANPYTTPQSEAPNVASPIRNPTSIPTDGAYERPRLRPNSANDIITGNVAGGKEFRGSLPYNVQSQLGAGLSDSGSSSVRSFLRRSSGSPYVSPYGDSSKPYYDPMQATTSFRPSELSGQSRPAITTPSSIAKVSVPQWTDLQRMSQPQRPAWQETTELESVIMQQMGLRELALMEEQLNKLNPDQLERLNPRLRQFMETTEEQSNTSNKTPDLLFDESLRPFQPDKPIEPIKLTEAERLRIQRDQLEQMRKELETLLEPETDTRTQPKPESKPEPTPQGPEKKTTSSADSKSALPPLPPRSSDKSQTPTVEPKKAVESVDKPFRLPSPEQRTRIRQLLGPYKNFETLTADKTADYLQQGDQFMVKRQYYRAADAYLLATVWRNNEPQIYLKQAFAMFSAGAYLSSAQSLQQALYLKPELGGEKIDYLYRLGGNISTSGSEAIKMIQKENEDLYQNRMREVIKFQKDSDSGMLALLMSYFYFQEGNLSKAQENIEISAHYFPDDPAVAAMQKILLPDAAPVKVTP